MPYTKFKKNELILRDELAVDRTLLANERTLLAYLRSGISMIIAGVTIMHFATYITWFWIIGLSLVPIGFFAIIIGTTRYIKINKAISSLRKK